MANGISMARVEEIIDSYGAQRSNLIAIMQDVQAEYKYLSVPVLELIAEKLNIGVAKVYSVATFYENFSLEAKGKYIIKVCDGTACHVKKSHGILNALRSHLKLADGKNTTDDFAFTVETVSCLGACGLAPVMVLDGEVHGQVVPDEAVALVEEIIKKEAAESQQ